MPIASVGYCSVFVRMCCRLTPRYSYRTDLIVVQLMCRIFSWYCRSCCWNWRVVGIHCDALSRDGTMWLVLVLWWSLSLSSWLLLFLVPFLWLWLVKNFLSYRNHRFHHRSTHTQSACQIAYQRAPRPTLLIMMMPNSVYIECIGMIHQNGQCLRLAPEMTQKLCFSM